MVEKSVIQKIFSKIKRAHSDPLAYEDLFALCMRIEKEDFELAHETNAELRQAVTAGIQSGENVERLFNVYRKTLLFDAPYDFDSYLLYVEIDRPPEERFYQPRRKVMKPLVDALQELANDELDELFLSMPPRTGKTSMLMFYITWLIGRDPERSNLYSAYSDAITRSLYNGVLEVITDSYTYKWGEVFPGKEIVMTNAAEETLDIGRKKRYHSLTARSLYGTLNGACDCNGVLISDDLIGGIEEALNKDRMVSAWSKVDNNLLTRAKEYAKVLWCGTRWSIIDPAGLRMELLKNDARFANRRFKIINLPALDENDESNFVYEYGVGFSTEYYRERRASFERNNDMASWNAQYMGAPIEREGALFTPDEFRYYNGELPDETPDRVFMAVDPAFGGGDFVAAPVAVQYGDDIFIHDVVFDNGDKRVTQPLIVQMVKNYGVNAIQFEATKATQSYKEEVEKLLREENIRINITTKPAPSDKAKGTRIFDHAPNIRESFIFRESGKRNKPYSLFMQNVFSFKAFGKNKHDDAPDSLAILVDMILKPRKSASIFHRIF